jgi:hypothetical protein
VSIIRRECGAHLGRLWSLWEIMKPFNAGLFLSTIHALGLLQRGKKPVPESSEAKAAVSVFQQSAAASADLGLTLSGKSADKLVKLMLKPDVSNEKFKVLIAELRTRLIEEMPAPRFFSLSDQEARYYQRPWEGWEKVVDRFRNATIDIEESSKCFALSRYAAAVFHSLQVAEIGVIELGRVIVVVDPQKGWGATTNRLKGIMRTDYRARTPFQQKHTEFLEQISANIEIVSRAWRNKISHAQGKLILLTSDFSQEVAEEILYATRGFMRRLATEAPTSVDPDA